MNNINENKNKVEDFDIYTNTFSDKQSKEKEFFKSNNINNLKENEENSEIQNIEEKNLKKSNNNIIKQEMTNNNKNNINNQKKEDKIITTNNNIINLSTENENVDIIKESNNNNNTNQIINNNNEINSSKNFKKKLSKKSKSLIKSTKLYTIKETESSLYLENIKNSKVIKIDKYSNKILQLKDFSEILDLIPMKVYHVDSILGIIDLNGNNKYLLVVSSSQLIISILGGDIYNILDVHLIKISLFNETEIERSRIAGIKKLFQTKNFYYSIGIDLTSNNIFSKNKKNEITKFCLNASLLKCFFDNLISNEFYSKIIYGYIGFKKNQDIEKNENKILFINLIIERVNKYLIFSNDIPNQVKEIEFICIYKNENIENNNINKKKNINIYSFIIYISNEISNSKNSFNPWNNFIKEQFSIFKNIVCIINNNINTNIDDNININNNEIGNIIFNSNTFGQKVKLLNFTSNWKKNLYFDSFNNSNMYIKNGILNSNIIQEYVFWIIDINNLFFDNYCCFNIIIRIMWKAIQQQFELMNLGIDLGEYNDNNNGIYLEKFKELIMNYYRDLNNNKKSLYKSKLRKQLQKIFDFYFNPENNNKNNINFSNNINKKIENNNPNKNIIINNNYLKNSQNIDTNQNINQKKIENLEENNINYNKTNKVNNNQTNKVNIDSINNSKKLSILCITWNIGGIPSDNMYELKDLFIKNIFHKNKQFPDIIVIGMQEIVKLDFYNILTITTNEDSRYNWTQNISFTLNKIYPHIYSKFIALDLIGIYSICFVKTELKDKIELISKNIIKTGLFGTFGNKGYVTFTLRYNNDFIISFVTCHLEAGQNSNKERIDTLKQILNSKINNYNEIKFQNSDFWIILGDLNFRIETSFELAYQKIKKKEFKDLIRYDQFNSSCKRDEELAIINEGIINFAPTYKFVQGSNNYLNDPEEMRIPSYCDRVFFSNKRGIRNIEYKNISSLMHSDHRPVYACFEIDNLEYTNPSNNNIINDKNNNFQSNNNIENFNNNNNNFEDYYNNNKNISNANNNSNNNQINNDLNKNNSTNIRKNNYDNINNDFNSYMSNNNNNNNSDKKLNQNNNNKDNDYINNKGKKEEEINKKNEQGNKWNFNYFNIGALKKFFQ